ncbi:MAG TPA: LysM peptidoglycan-binding domain-containing protein, partial [Ktedonobacterales bacterium]|nr:LysM peptidoglycan-binding domain-containing protein [Ktedonobacterales bacterium]
SEWLNHSSNGPATRDIFARPERSRRKRALRLAGRGVVGAGRGLVRLGKFSYRKMQPMRIRDWVSVSALVVVLVAMGAYMVYEKHSDDPLLQGCRWHTVDVGDTLITLARSSGVSVSDIARANGVYDVKDPPIGQPLCIPSQTGVAQAAGNIPHASQTTGPVIQGEAAYVRFVLPYARQVHDATGWPISVILAQWGLEQGWQTPTFTGYNFGNCGGLANEPFIPGTAAVGSPSTFAYADTPEDGVRYYIHVAGLSYYAKIAPAARSGGPEAAAKALGASPWDAGHYTNANDPGSSLIALMRQYNLTQYD